MTSRLKLEVFDSSTPEGNGGHAVVGGTAFDLEEARLEAFESGYRAGWDDAATANETEDAASREAVSRTLQELAFTYHEARNHILRALSPLLSEITARILPEVARASLPHLVAEALGPYAEIVSEAPIKVSIHPNQRALVEGLMGRNPGLPLQLIEDAGLSLNRVVLSLGTSETRVDLDSALITIRTAIDDFFELTLKETHHR